MEIIREIIDVNDTQDLVKDKMEDLQIHDDSEKLRGEPKQSFNAYESKEKDKPVKSTIEEKDKTNEEKKLRQDPLDYKKEIQPDTSKLSKLTDDSDIVKYDDTSSDIYDKNIKSELFSSNVETQEKTTNESSKNQMPPGQIRMVQQSWRRHPTNSLTIFMSQWPNRTLLNMMRNHRARKGKIMKKPNFSLEY